MKVALFSNFYNNHVSDFCIELNNLCSGSFLFIEMSGMDETRAKMNFSNFTAPFVKKYSDLEETQIENIINYYDVVITGSDSDFLYKERLRTGKLVFKLSEHPFKGKTNVFKRYLKRILWLIKYKNKKNSFLLAMSSRCARDFNNFAFKNHILNFGYFPTYFENDIKFTQKDHNSILWVGRMIWWKHPEIAIAVAKRLRDDGLVFNLNMVGAGYDYEKIQESIEEYGCTDCIHMLGLKSQNETIEIMKKSKYFLFTSDSNEGWGAVLNEAMNSKCICIASELAGSTKLLLNDSNGFITDNSVENIYKKIRALFMEQSVDVNHMSEAAYFTIKNSYNGLVAARRFFNFSRKIVQYNKIEPYDDGLMSLQLRK